MNFNAQGRKRKSFSAIHLRAGVSKHFYWEHPTAGKLKHLPWCSHGHLSHYGDDLDEYIDEGDEQKASFPFFSGVV